MFIDSVGWLVITPVEGEIVVVSVVVIGVVVGLATFTEILTVPD